MKQKVIQVSREVPFVEYQVQYYNIPYKTKRELYENLKDLKNQQNGAWDWLDVSTSLDTWDEIEHQSRLFFQLRNGQEREILSHGLNTSIDQYLDQKCQRLRNRIKQLEHQLKERQKLKVDVYGGVAYSNNPHIKIYDHD